MPNWKKLNKEFDEALNSMSDKNWQEFKDKSEMKMKKEEIKEYIFDLWDECQDRNIGSNESELDFKESVTNYIYNCYKTQSKGVSDEEIEGYFETHPRLNPTYNEMKWVKLGASISNKLQPQNSKED